MELDFFPLKSNEICIEQCINLLNEEWPRSRSCRMRSLALSNDTFPMSFLMVLKEADEVKLIGHSRLKQIPNDPQAVFIESVVVGKKYRGKGLGHKLMLQTENYAKSLGITHSILTTIDKIPFYKKLEYEFTGPVQLYGCNVAKTLQKNKIVTLAYSNDSYKSNSIITNCNINTATSGALSNSNIPIAPPLPIVLSNNSNIIPLPTALLNNNIPIPPPLPILKNKSFLPDNIKRSGKVYMRKVL